MGVVSAIQASSSVRNFLGSEHHMTRIPLVLYILHRRAVISGIELRRFLRFTRPESYTDWAVPPRWVQRSTRLNIVWALCRLSYESPMLLFFGTLALPPAIVSTIIHLAKKVF